LEDEVIEGLVESAVHLLAHPVALVRTEAVGVLKCALDYKMVPPLCAKPVLLAIVQHKDVTRLKGLDQLVNVLAKASTGFAKELSNHFYSKLSSGLTTPESKLFATLCTNDPRVLIKKGTDVLKQAESKSTEKSVAKNLVAALLAKRQTQYFAGPAVEKESETLQLLISSKTSRWDQYRMACQAMVLGDFCYAALALNDLAESSLNEEHFLWISSLKEIAVAEALLCSSGSQAIPDASCRLHTSLSYIHHLHSTNDGTKQQGFTFQSRCIFLRLDQLDLITVIRQLTRETRLTGAVPAKNTRHHQHLMNAVRCLQSLALRFRKLNQKFGLLFQSGMSTSCLVVQEEVCDFLANATQVAFSEIFGPTKPPSDRRRKKSTLLISKLMIEMDKHIVQPMKSPLEPIVRAAAMLELLEGVLTVPTPFPRDFFCPRAEPVAHLNLVPFPAENAEFGGKPDGPIECFPSICFYLQVNGKIPKSLMQNARRPIVCVFVWCRLLYSSPLDEEEDTEAPAKEAIKARIPDVRGPHNLFLLADGRFHGTLEMAPLPDEGHFVLETKVGCRDSRGAEWEVSTATDSCKILIHSSRSR